MEAQSIHTASYNLAMRFLRAEFFRWFPLTSCDLVQLMVAATRYIMPLGHPEHRMVIQVVGDSEILSKSTICISLPTLNLSLIQHTFPSLAPLRYRQHHTCRPLRRRLVL